MAVNLFGTLGSEFSFLPSIGGFSATSPLDLGSYTTAVPLNTNPMLIAAASYEATAVGGGFAGQYTGTLQFSWGNVPMTTYMFSTAILVGPGYGDTHSTVVGLLPFDASTVFADDHVRLSFTGAPGFFGTKAGLIGVAQNVDPSSIFTNQVVKSTLDTTSPLSMLMPAVAGNSGDMILGILMSAYSGVFGTNYTTPDGTPPFVVDTYVPLAIYQYAIAYRQLSAAESDQVQWDNPATAGFAVGWFSTVFDLKAKGGSPVINSTGDPWLLPKWEDKTSIDSWLAYHDVKHSTLRKEASRQGKTITQTSFRADPDPTWFRRHRDAHVALESVWPTGFSNSSVLLATERWDDEQQFYDWHTRHMLIHSRLKVLSGTL